VLIGLILFYALDEAKQSSGLSPACKDAARTAGVSWEGRKEAVAREPQLERQSSGALNWADCQWCWCSVPDVSMSLCCPERSDTNHSRRPIYGPYCAVCT
jgi:hypothetical protein